MLPWILLQTLAGFSVQMPPWGQFTETLSVTSPDGQLKVVLECEKGKLFSTQQREFSRTQREGPERRYEALRKFWRAEGHTSAGFQPA